MRKQGRKEELVQSKYFSIDSYFKSPPHKKVKTAFHKQIEQQLSTLEARKEQCPLCSTMISIESVSMEVHVNACLDSQQEKAEGSKSGSFDCEVDCAVDSSSQKRQFVESKENVVTIYKTEISDYEAEENVTEGDVTEECETEGEDKGRDGDVKAQKDATPSSVVQHEESGFAGLARILPSSWKSLFSSSSAVVTPPLRKNTNTLLNQPSKQRPCPFYKRVRGNIFFLQVSYATT